MQTLNSQALLQIGGSEWNSGEHRRIYFGHTSDWVDGLEVNRYKTGRISSARLDGSKLSNNKASKLVASIDSGKFFYDLNTDTLVFERLDADIAERIERKLMAAYREVA